VRKLIPEGSSAKQIEWVRTAKAAGLFQTATRRAPATAPGAPPPAGVSRRDPERPTPREVQELGAPGTPRERKAQIRAKLAAWEKA
jgi:hypothetical protein